MSPFFILSESNHPLCSNRIRAWRPRDYPLFSVPLLLNPITVGGAIAATLVTVLVETIQLKGLSIEWDGEPFDRIQLPVDGPLQLHAQEVANGEFDELEAFCSTNDLPFRRWSGGSSGSFAPEIIVWTGQGERRRYSADEDGHAVITAEYARELGSYDAILRCFAEAAFDVPALRAE